MSLTLEEPPLIMQKLCRAKSKRDLKRNLNGMHKLARIHWNFWIRRPTRSWERPEYYQWVITFFVYLSCQRWDPALLFGHHVTYSPFGCWQDKIELVRVDLLLARNGIEILESDISLIFDLQHYNYLILVIINTSPKRQSVALTTPLLPSLLSITSKYRLTIISHSTPK